MPSRIAEPAAFGSAVTGISTLAHDCYIQRNQNMFKEIYRRVALCADLANRFLIPL